ncbi:hypothetical protein [uncultured Hyphomicrobium sp.]|uniref:hypothetical protein n=1 Tax=uncultured Hyphomicrobium sp. TaxID=194373 RepID=UPI0025D76518|nr:hypothetical protein [uncultured Hyphomicrobium sp.]
MTERTEEVAGFVIFLLTTLLGYFGIAWWALGAPILLLAALRYDHHVKFAREHPVYGTDRVLVMAITATFLNSTLFATLVFAMGRAIAWLIA